MALCILFLTLSFLYCQTNALPQQASIGLWSDSECNSKSGLTSNFGEIDPIALNFTLLPDVCGVPGATVHSYRITQNAICANGTTPLYKYYNSNNCTADPTDENPNPGLGKRMQDRRDAPTNLEGLCLALVAFNSFAFICDGLAPQNSKVVPLSTTTVVSKTASPSVTPSVISIFVSIYSPTQSIAATSSSATSFSTTNSSTPNSSSRSPLTASPPIGSGAPVTSPTATFSPVTGNAAKSAPSAGTGAGFGVISTIGTLAIAVLLSV